MPQSFNALPFRAYNLIWNEWFRDQNMQDSVAVPKGDGPDDMDTYTLLRRGKRHDYFTSALPWPQKGDAVSLPLGTAAPVRGIGLLDQAWTTSNDVDVLETGSLSAQVYGDAALVGSDPGTTADDGIIAVELQAGLPQIWTDLSSATAATINQLRQAFQIQRLLERNARGGTRYTELIRAHFGVTSPDARLQRPEYLGGGSAAVNVNPVAQTSETTETGTPLGQLGGIATSIANGHGFSQSFTEHGYIIGLACVRADLTYQQGMHRMWSRRTRYDIYWPAFAHLGEQAVLMKEIFSVGDPENDDLVFGYQERWSEYRYKPSRISGLFRSTASEPLDAWHLAQEFDLPPTLNEEFIVENPPMDRILAVGEAAGGQQFLFDSFFDVRMTRAMPTYSVPGLIDHF